jgi:uncharacterized protein (DUF433 family)
MSGTSELAPGITSDPQVRFGRPVIKGTRIDVATIPHLLAAGTTHEEIVKQYGITEADIRAALSYAAKAFDKRSARAR